MKIGFRTPSISKSISARTSGRLNRAVKSANPIYSKKGTGVIRDPKRAAYSAVYHRTTAGVSDVLSDAKDAPPDIPPSDIPPDNRITGDSEPPKTPFYKKKVFWIILISALVIGGLANKKDKPDKVAEAVPTVAPTETPEPTPKPTEEPTPKPTHKPKPTEKPKKAKKRKKRATYVYVAASGNGSCYHSSPSCSGMNGNVIKMKMKEARKIYRACQRCY